MTLTRKILRGNYTAWIVLGFSLLLSGVIWYWAEQLMLQRASDRFTFQCQEIKDNILDRMNNYQTVLRGGVGLFRASASVEHDEWKSYVDGLALKTYFPGIQGLGYTQIIRPAELARHETAMKAVISPGYRVRPDGDRQVYTSILYLEPLDWRNQRAIGYDMFSEPVRRAAMERARDSGVAALSGKVLLVQETKQDVQNGVLMYQPVYRNGAAATTVEERRAALQGYVYSPFRMNDLMQGLLRNSLTNVDFHLYDTSVPSAKTLLYAYQSDDDHFAYPATTALFDRTLMLNINGRIWTLYIHTLPGYIPANERNLPLLFGAAGLGFSLLLFFYIRTLSLRYRQTLQLAHEMTSDLRNSEARASALIEYAPDTIIVIDQTGLIQACNPAGEQLSGWRAEELIGKNVNLLIPSPHHEAHDGYLAHYLATGQTHIIGEGRDVEMRHKDGRLIPIHLRVGVQRMKDGQYRFIGFLRDLTERIKADALIKDRQLLFRSVIDASVDGFWIADQTGRLLEVNDGYCQHSGYSRDELLCMNIRDIEVTESSADTEQRMARICQNGYELFETMHRAKDGHCWPVEVSVSYTDKTREPRLLAFLRDITDRKKQQEQLNNNNIELEKLVEVRTEALMRHAEELRTQYEFLENSNRIMVGRELDMIRLKQQVNQLAEQLGESARYDLSFLDGSSVKR